MCLFSIEKIWQSTIFDFIFSLPCVKEHKIQRNCDGIRSKTEFVKVGEFTDTHLLNGT